MKKILLCTMMALLAVTNAAANPTEEGPVKGLKVVQDKPFVLKEQFRDDMPDGVPGLIDHRLTEVPAPMLSKKIALSATAEYTDEQGVIYGLDEGTQTYAVTGHTDDLKNEIVIASEVEGLPVTSIGYMAFYKCGNLTSITIPNSVTSIDYGAFANTGLTSIVIPESVTWDWRLCVLSMRRVDLCRHFWQCS